MSAKKHLLGFFECVFFLCFFTLLSHNALLKENGGSADSWEDLKLIVDSSEAAPGTPLCEILGENTLMSLCGVGVSLKCSLIDVRRVYCIISCQ